MKREGSELILSILPFEWKTPLSILTVRILIKKLRYHLPSIVVENQIDDQPIDFTISARESLS